MSVRKRTWTNAKDENKEAWIVDYADSSGKRRLKTFARKKDADAFAATARVEIAAGVHTPESMSPTVKDAAAGWLKDCEAAGLERSTLAQYRQHEKLHITPLIGATKLSRLTVPAVAEFRDKLAEEGRSPALIRKILVSLGSIVAHAKERGRFAGANPVRDLPRGKRARVEKRQKGALQVGRDIPTREEIKLLLAATPSGAPPILAVACFCGLRASELRGLRWSDVDLKGELHVRQRADRYGVIGPPKSRAGERKIPIPPGALLSLKEWKLACPKSETGLVFPTASGCVMHHKNLVREILDPAQIAAGMLSNDGAPKYGLHSLRHFFASWCINRKVDGGRELPLKAVQVLMGHGSITMTADVYGHLFPRGDDAAELAQAEKGILG